MEVGPKDKEFALNNIILQWYVVKLKAVHRTDGPGIREKLVQICVKSKQIWKNWYTS